VPGYDIVEDLRAFLDTFNSAGFAFQPDGGQATDVLSALLCDEYWGARVIIYRPFIRQILESNFNKPGPDGDLPSNRMTIVICGERHPSPDRELSGISRSTGAIHRSKHVCDGS
jgi:hypothetical protein